MAKVTKIRVVPRNYQPLNDGILSARMNRIIDRHSSAELFMCMFGKFGKPQEGMSYMLRHNNVVLRIKTSGGKVEYEVYVSPGYIQNARRKQTKIMNVIARRINEEGVIFVPCNGLPDSLYYAVRMKNAELRERKVKDSIERMDAILTEEEKVRLYGGLSQYMPEVLDELSDIIRYVTNEA